MRDPLKSTSQSFDFFRKRKRPDRSVHSNGYISPLLSQNSDSAQQASQKTFKSSSSGSKRGTFRGLLTSNHAGQSNGITIDAPEEATQEPLRPPTIDVEACKAVNYMIWARDQMLFGNDTVLNHPHFEAEFASLVEDLKAELSTASRMGHVNGNMLVATIASAILERCLDVQDSHAYLSTERNSYCRLSIVHLNGCLYIRPVDYNRYSFDGHLGAGTTANFALDIDGRGITEPVFIDARIFPRIARQCELLPSKLSNEYIHRQVEIKFDYVANLVTRALFARATRELVIVRALVDVPGFNCAPFEGFELEGISTGDRAWMPIYICQRLSQLGVVVAELPQFLHLERIREIRALERASQGLQKLDSVYYFELAHLFTNSKLIAKVQVPQRHQHNVFRYISKVAGVVEDLKYLRASKITRALEQVPIHETVIQMENIQFSETYLVNQVLPAFSSQATIRGCMEQLPRQQICELVGDLENKLMQSCNEPLI